MDGACTTKMTYPTKCNPKYPPYPCPANNQGATDCTEYSYVSDPAIGPYWQIAEDYGFANYMFQTNQGPSFPAHQFLLSGTSAPGSTQNPDYTYFAAENMSNGAHPMEDAGCAATSDQLDALISPPPADDESTSIYPCFEHPTLTDLLDQNNVTWRYYGDQDNSIWTAPNAISHICNNSVSNGGGGCGSGNGSNNDWNKNVGPYLELADAGPPPSLAPFLRDLQNCSLAQVTWVIPDGRWSDHPSQNLGLGPDYVASIVNAVGGTGPPVNNCGFWNNTVILVVWDDWGGWYDHVNPNGPDGPGIGYSNNTGGQYVYGFRVPLLVVSTFAKQHYISGTKSAPIRYDFGSILRFIEETFLPPLTFINPAYPYADQFVALGQNDLSDFFGCFTPACQNPFQPITLVNNSQLCNQTQCKSNQCDATCFINYQGNHEDPDTY
jgi:phospholipase C